MKIVDLRCDYADSPIAVASVRPRYSWRLQADPGEAPPRQRAWRVRVQLAEGPAGDAVLWDSGWRRGASMTHVVHRGAPPPPCHRVSWTVEVEDSSGARSRSEPARYETTLRTEEDWRGAQWIGVTPMWIGRPAYFRATFEAAADTRFARLYLAGLGCHRVWVNGREVDDRLLEPPPTDYEKRVLFTTYALDALVEPGLNTLVVACAAGWYGHVQFRCRLLLRDAHGAESGFSSGVPTCQFFTRVGGWLSAGIYDGEVYDSRLHPAHWLDGRGRNDWRLPEPPGTLRTESHFNARRVPGPGGRMTAHCAEPIRITRRFAPASVRPLPGGALVVDAGENLAGFLELRPGRPSGTIVILRFAEFLGTDGRPDQTNLYTAACADTYVCSGAPGETYRPQFTYHGFRYVEITGLEGVPDPGAITVCEVRSDVARRAGFSTSHELLNRIHRMVVRTEAANQHGLLTDCPQRAERMGWLNDPTARMDQAAINFDLNRLMEKWIDDVADTQDESGAIADTAPFLWGSRPADPVCIAPALIPWLMYRHHGNRRLLERAYPVARRWHAFLRSRAPDNIVTYSLYGDWCPPLEFGKPNDHGNSLSRDTPGELVSTALWLELTELLRKTASILRRHAEARAYAAEETAIRTAFHSAFHDPGTGGYGANNQAANALALCRGIPPPELAPRVLENLVGDVLARRGRLTTGNICTKYLLEALSTHGRVDAALAVVARTDYPGWGYMLEHGATTLWERWELNTSSGMNSHNHPMLGSVGAWLHRYVLGLRDDEEAPPFSRFVLQPPMLAEIEHAQGHLITPLGRLEAAWRRVAGGLEVELSVPPHTTVDVLLPGRHLRARPGGFRRTFPLALTSSPNPVS